MSRAQLFSAQLLLWFSHVSNVIVLLRRDLLCRSLSGPCSRLLHSMMLSCRPLLYPDLQQLRESFHWDSVIVSGIPGAPVAASSPASASPDTNGFAVSSTSCQESLMGSQAESHRTIEISQADVADVEAQSMLILGLQGHNHDLERYILFSAPHCAISKQIL